MTGSGSFARWQRLSAYLDGELAPAEAAAVERELEHDAALRAALDDLRERSRALRIEDADYRAAQGIRAAVQGRIAARGRRSARALARWWWLPAAAAAVLAFAALRPGGPFAPAPQRVQVQAVAEQYALALDDLGSRP